MHYLSVQQWLWFDSLACLATPGNKVNILDYMHPFFYQSVLLHSSCQGLRQWSEIHFSCFTQRVGQEIPFVHPRFGDGWAIHPTIHTHACRYIHQKTHLYTFVLSNCHFLCAIPVQHWHSLLSLLDSLPLKHSTMWHLMTSSVPPVCVSMADNMSQWTSPDHWTVKSMGTPVGTAQRDMSKSTGINQQTTSKSNTWYFDSSERSTLLLCNWGTDTVREVVDSTIQIVTIIAFSVTCLSYFKKIFRNLWQ